MKKEMDIKDIKLLRDTNRLFEDEVAYYVGDIVIAENVIKGSKRIINDAASVLKESRRRILKG